MNASGANMQANGKWSLMVYILESTVSGRMQRIINTSDRYKCCITGARLRRFKWQITPTSSDVRVGYGS